MVVLPVKSFACLFHVSQSHIRMQWVHVLAHTSMYLDNQRCHHILHLLRSESARLSSHQYLYAPLPQAQAAEMIALLTTGIPPTAFWVLLDWLGSEYMPDTFL